MNDTTSFKEYSTAADTQSERTNNLLHKGGFAAVSAFSAAGLAVSAIATSFVSLDQVAGLAGQVLWG